MREEVIKSDITGKVLKDYIHVSIEKPNMTIEYPTGHFTNRLEIDIEERELPLVLDKIKFSAQTMPISRSIEVRPLKL